MTSVREEILGELLALEIYDPHSHVDPRAPVATHLADLLGYHYYTELAHASGLAKDRIEADGLDARAKCVNLVEHLATLDNTIQYGWLIDILRTHYGFQGDRLTPGDVDSVMDAVEAAGARADRAQEVLTAARLKGVFLTNEFDEDLDDFDTATYIPCLRTDTLVFQLDKLATRDRVQQATGHDPRRVGAVRDALETLVRKFKGHGARACAISLPPDFEPDPVSNARAASALDAIITKGDAASASHREKLSRFVFWTLAELCDEVGLPFDLMIGVNRSVYPGGVHQGRDLYDSRVSLTQYRKLFNAFPRVTFPVSVLASVTNQELVSHAWIFPNVVACGHWWYSNTPSLIDRDLAHRLEALPKSEIVGYYSDAYKLEFCQPKIDMFRRVLARVLARDFADDRGWSVERCVELGTAVLRDNTEAVFGLDGREPRRPPGPVVAAADDLTEVADDGPSFATDEPLVIMPSSGGAAVDAPTLLGRDDVFGFGGMSEDRSTAADDAGSRDGDADRSDAPDDPLFVPGLFGDDASGTPRSDGSKAEESGPEGRRGGPPSTAGSHSDIGLDDMGFDEGGGQGYRETSPAMRDGDAAFGPVGREDDAHHTPLVETLDLPAGEPDLPLTFDPLAPEPGLSRPAGPPPRTPARPPARPAASPPARPGASGAARPPRTPSKADDLFDDLDEDDLLRPRTTDRPGDAGG